MKGNLIPLLLIFVGGAMVFAGIKNQNPVTVFKNVLTNIPTPNETAPPPPPASASATPAAPSSYVPMAPTTTTPQAV